MSTRLSRSLAAETRKLFATKTIWVLGLVLTGYVGLMAALFGLMFSELGAAMGAGGGQGAELDPAAGAGIVYAMVTSMGYVIPLILGALAVTGEYRHRTLAVTLTAEPRRGVVLASKLLVLAAAGAALGLIGLLGTVGLGGGTIALTGGSAELGTPAVLGVIARVIPAMALWAAIGVGLGVLVRSQAIAIVIGLAFTQFLEPVLRLTAGLWEWTARLGSFLPGAATDAFVGAGLFTNMGALDPSLADSGGGGLGVWQGGLTLLGYALLLAGLGWWLRWRRDVA